MFEHQTRFVHIGGHFGAPEILRGREQAFAFVFGQFRVERRLAEKGIIAQQPLAKAVDGVDGGIVKLTDGGFEAHRQARQAFAFQRTVQQVENKAIGRRIIAVQAIKRGQGFGIGCRRAHCFINLPQIFQRLQSFV